MCNCRRGKTAPAARGYEVKYPNGAVEKKSSEMAAKMAAARVPGATWASVKTP